MAPRYGRAYGSQRANLSAPYHRGHQITMIGAISIEKIEAALYGQWATNGEVFTHFLEQSLRPMLSSNHVVVMDNVSFHKVQRVHELIQTAGARLVYLPPYHPELNPIEEMWSKIKNKLRQLSARTLSTFQIAIKKAFQDVTQSDLIGWFKHAGY
ncbi:MAG: hypothetical protein GKR77_03355 [Legionellales bacterium]|nr:hypothetical protein [Legionellales bacterium]